MIADEIRAAMRRGFADIMEAFDESMGCQKPQGMGELWCQWNRQDGPPCESCANLQRMIEGAFGVALGLSIKEAYHSAQAVETPPSEDAVDPHAAK